MSDDHEVGYKKPPSHSRFKKGQSGNPKGRPAGTRNLRTDLLEELRAAISIREGSRERQISMQQALLKSQLAKAIKGDSRAAGLIITLILKVTEGEALDTASAKLSADDTKILEQFAERILAVRHDKVAPTDEPADQTPPASVTRKVG